MHTAHPCRRSALAGAPSSASPHGPTKSTTTRPAASRATLSPYHAVRECCSILHRSCACQRACGAAARRLLTADCCRPDCNAANTAVEYQHKASGRVLLALLPVVEATAGAPNGSAQLRQRRREVMQLSLQLAMASLRKAADT